MCGILCEICFNSLGKNIGPRDYEISQRIKNRGPDCSRTIDFKLENETEISFCGSVLWMQGPEVTPQPLENNLGVLLYNGDIFDETWSKSKSDTQIIMDKINSEVSESNIINAVKSLKGPFTLIYFDKINKNIYFVRDRIGRSSLLLHKTDDFIVISSVLGRKYKCIEIPATYIYKLNLFTLNLELYPWSKSDIQKTYCIDEWVEEIHNQQTLPDDKFAFEFDQEINITTEDSVIEYIDGISKNLKCHHDILSELLNQALIRETLNQLTSLLEKSVRIRLQTQPQKCKECLQYSIETCDHCSVGVLFSGGLDCTILAFLADKFLSQKQSIDLINVAFKKDATASYDVPDRVTGRQSYEELKNICPLRKWVFKEINVEKEEIERIQSSTIGDLVYPRQTILDESLGTALWFAASGRDTSSTVSPCRVLLLGSGADELFGGYTRHRNAFRRNGWQGLGKELALDWSRISFRNLARDNRVICDHGRQPRMPYLDEDFTNYVLQLKPWLKCFPSENLGPGIGDKLMLRLLAYNLGLISVAAFPKRALQFGSRIANKKEKGSDLSKTFINIELN